ncbi:MAG: AAA family ATPase [Solirubrobacterales bacterium]|nr:AAA family ATPase [Solirubrobacterales bacterium]MBV9537149.1 AAA family ATPase [Solirubrobacterales bacterium]
MVSCPSCGQQNPDGFRFCGACGAELTSAGSREVRKTVSVLFADVTGSTALGEQLDVESFRRVIAHYFDAAKRSIERHGGTVEKFIGDAVVAVFGVPTVHEDDALRALCAAMDLRGSLSALNEQLDRDYAVSLQLRTGVNTGEVVVTGDEQLATGDAVNTAARLEQSASPGEILIGEQTWRLARGAIEWERVAPLAVKGKAKPISAFRLLRVVEGAPAFERRLDSPLVGRRVELARVRAAFDEAISERRCRLVTVLGPPGIGKSRLAAEVAAALAGDAKVLSGRCLPYGEGITYWPLVEIFRGAGAEQELETALGVGALEEIFWAVRKALERRARQRPLALIVEDIHWAEPTLLDLLEHLSQWTREAPLLVLCLARPELIDRRPAWDGIVIPLEALSPEESDQLVEGLTGESRLANDMRARLRELAHGNPLLVEQLLAHFAEGGDPGRAPPTIDALLAARLDSLPNEQRELIERASVIGLEFEWDALAQLAPDRRRPGGARLAALVRKDLIRPHDAIEDAFRFRHILIRDAAYERLPKALRSQLHERFADWLQGRGEEFEAIVGYHLEQAHRCLMELGPPDARAQSLAERAAECLSASSLRASARGDTRAAANLLQRSAALLPARDPRRLALLPPLGRALVEVGEIPEADSVLSEAVESARATGQDGVAVDAALELAALRLNNADAAVGQAGVWRELERAIPFYEHSGDEAGLARALGIAGTLRHWRGEAAAAIEDFTRAAHHARNAGEVAQEVESLWGALAAMLLGPTPVDQALTRIEGLSPAAAQSSSLRLHVMRTRASLEAMRGRFQTARDLISQAKDLAAELGQEVTLARIALNAGPIELLAGDPAAAERELQPAYDALKRMEHWGFLASIVPRFVDALLAQGRDDEGLRLTEVIERHIVPEDVDAQVGWRRVRARLLARRSDLEQAKRLAREAVTMAERTDHLDLTAEAHAALAEVLHAAGSNEHARRALERAVRLYEQKGNVVGAEQARSRLTEPQPGTS